MDLAQIGVVSTRGHARTLEHEANQTIAIDNAPFGHGTNRAGRAMAEVDLLHRLIEEGQVEHEASAIDQQCPRVVEGRQIRISEPRGNARHQSELPVGPTNDGRPCGLELLHVLQG